MPEITKDEMRERLGNIDKIRDIILGTQMREYDNRIDKIESDLSLLQQDLRDRIEQVKSAFSTELKAAVDSLDKKLKSISTNASEESADVRLQLERLNKKFSNSIEVLDQTLDRQTSSVREELTQNRDKLQEDVRTLRSHVFEELDKRFSMLRDLKLSKDDMAEILFELGMRLKGNEFVPELKEAGDSDTYKDWRLLGEGRNVE